MRVLLALVLTACMAMAVAGETFRFSRGVVSVGDSIAQLVDRAGQPTRVVRLENRFGAGMGERWEYFLPNGKYVGITISDGRIEAIMES